MKRYTLEDFKKFGRNEFGYIICPSGDYTGIPEFPAYCIFEANCRFWDECGFGQYCHFGKDCKFGYGCNFGKSCRFGELCDFENECNFKDNCSFGKWCHFGEFCIFENNCKFEKWCNFGENCLFLTGCSFEKYCEFGEACIFSPGCTVEGGKEIKSYTKIKGIVGTRRCTYLYQLTDGSVYIRFGVISGYEDKFLSAINEKYGSTVYEQYQLALELAKLTFQEEVK